MLRILTDTDADGKIIYVVFNILSRREIAKFDNYAEAKHFAFGK
jgi:hypothetical protein